MKTKKRTIIIAVVVIALVVAGLAFKKSKSKTEVGYEYDTVTKGDIENLVSCTGTLKAIGTVDVGTQLSGTVNEVRADFNEHVRKGQILAVIDTTQNVLNARSSAADLKRAEAQYKIAKEDYQSAKDLLAKHYISQYELDVKEKDMIVAQANVVTAKATHQRNINNLHMYSVIRAPIDGTVINRAIEPGQTVAASFSTPTLFTIAKDLSQMEIEANIDESDIGQVKVGLEAKFTVDAYPDKEFKGEIKQIRLQPQTISNVVNYTVIVDAPNPEKLLLPGMTATVDFIIDHKENVITVSNSALQYKPDQDIMRAVFMRKRAEFAKKGGFGNQQTTGARNGGSSDSNATAVRGNKNQRHGDSTFAGNGTGGSMGFGGTLNSSKDRGRLWFLNDKGELDFMRITIGATDGSRTEVTSDNIKIGAQYIIKEAEVVKEQKKTVSIIPTMGPRGGRRH